MNWSKQANGQYRFNINRLLQGDTIRVEFPLHATVSDINEYLRRYTYPNERAYQSSTCFIYVRGIEQSDHITVADLKYKKLSAGITCPVHITQDSNWIADTNDGFTFTVGVPHQSEIIFKMRSDTTVDKLRISICQRQGIPDLVICANGHPISDDTQIRTIYNQYITAI